MPLSPHPLSIPTLGLWLLLTRIVFCKDGKEISVQPKGGNTLVYDSPYTVSKESTGAFSCLYQLKDDNNQENNSLPSDPWYLHVDGPGPIVGLAVTASLALALLGCFLMRTGDLPAPSLILNKGPTPQGDTIILMCFIPMDTSVMRVIFCKDGKEILMLPKDRNKLIVESAQPASPESAGEYFCRYQHKDDRNQEKTSLPSAHRYLSAPVPAVLLWVWILRSTLVLLLMMSAPIITCIMEKRAVTQPEPERQERPAGNGRGEPPYAEGNGKEEE
ncbi:cyclic AMP-responsive element-binding protein 3 [Platysternon megacephalum]|uniref:Cyclic AMP-responsive element-binding protein 3 n=1 Tax=Platysternon megacephalum TaxID=55544 RepID=A0A4D9DY08_9SAUR|nr:cyclic AMP-responsive element-binding protein 3 [Platysternon megacephalum]